MTLAPNTAPQDPANLCVGTELFSLKELVTVKGLAEQPFQKKILVPLLNDVASQYCKYTHSLCCVQTLLKKLHVDIGGSNLCHAWHWRLNNNKPWAWSCRPSQDR
jgi:hypothetical protein